MAATIRRRQKNGQKFWTLERALELEQHQARGLTLKQIGALYGIGGSVIVSQLRNLRYQRERDAEQAKWAEERRIAREAEMEQDAVRLLTSLGYSVAPPPR